MTYNYYFRKRNGKISVPEKKLKKKKNDRFGIEFVPFILQNLSKIHVDIHGFHAAIVRFAFNSMS